MTPHPCFQPAYLTSCGPTGMGAAGMGTGGGMGAAGGKPALRRFTRVNKGVNPNAANCLEEQCGDCNVALKYSVYLFHHDRTLMA